MSEKDVKPTPEELNAVAVLLNERFNGYWIPADPPRSPMDLREDQARLREAIRVTYLWLRGLADAPLPDAEKASAEPVLYPAQSSPPHPTVPLQVWVDVDEGIVEAVRYLNTVYGIRTLSCCQGGKTYAPYVMATWTDEALARVSEYFTSKLEGDGWGYLYPIPSVSFPASAEPVAGLQVGAIPLRERRTLADEWKEFARTIPVGAPEVQRAEMQKAFYGGAVVMLSLLSNGLDANSEPTDLDVAYVESVSQELQAFVKSLS